MNRAIEFWLAPNERNLHSDFIMQIPGLNKRFIFDTYYFWNGGVLTDNYKSLAVNIESYMKKCGRTILSTSEQGSKYIPVDFSDQYYGCFYTKYLIEENRYVLDYVIVENQFAPVFNEDENEINLIVTNHDLPIEFSLSLTKGDVLKSFNLIWPAIEN